MAINSTMSIAVLSGKGGVGKTNVALNLAWALHKAHFKILLMDCDLGLANLDVLLGISPQGNLQNVLLGETSLSEVLYHVEPKGFDVLPAASGVSELSEIKNESRNVLLSQLEPLLGDYDYVFMDIGAGISETVQTFASMVIARVMVITPEPTSLTDSYALIKILHNRYNLRDFFVLVNQVASVSEGKTTFEKLAGACRHFLGLEPTLLGYIRHDPKVPEAVCKQHPLLRYAPGCPAAQDLQTLAEALQRMRLNMADTLAQKTILQNFSNQAT